MKVAILTANTEVYKEREEDKSGKVIRQILKDAGAQVVFAQAVPLDQKVLSTVMQRLADGHVADLVLTTGGAGCAPSDCTPEATLDIIERNIAGIPEAMRAHMMELTKRSMLNRAVAGIRGRTMIVNLPGKAGAVKECLEYLLPELTHGVQVIKGEA
ncbi:MogA/MoaB family molybdenum cofactor biosynthesis protein [Lachnospiraceae bacterium 50-23]|jgi:molybdopterin adenylyltransferase|nr:MogA/MoaB family molybdenum cofactor biosynthesis protein [Dorea sp.]GFI36391.1 molybdopterin adenylyltransferase [Lachnospiraceae bacterium]